MYLAKIIRLIFVFTYILTIVLSIPCGEPGTPFNGDRKFSGNQTSKGQYFRGTTVEYSCKSDAILLGNQKRQCFHKGFWDNKVPQCAQSVAIDQVLDQTLLDTQIVRSSAVRKLFDKEINSCFPLNTSDN